MSPTSEILQTLNLHHHPYPVYGTWKWLIWHGLSSKTTFKNKQTKEKIPCENGGREKKNHMSSIAKVAGGAVSEVRGLEQNSTQCIQKETTCQQIDLTLLEL